MTCDELRERDLDSYLDGDLRDADRRRIEEHLAGCRGCRDELAAWQELRSAARSLPAGIDPPRDLWPEVAARLLETPRAGSRRGYWAWGSLAAALVAALALLLVARPAERALPSVAAAPEVVPAAPAAVEAAASPVAAELAYFEDGLQQLQKDLLVALEQRRGDLEPDTLERVEKNLSLIHTAIGEIRAALDEDPSNRELNLLLAATYQKEVELLKRLTTL